MTGRSVTVAIVVGVIAVLGMGGLLWVNRPFQVELGAYRTSLADRTEAQRHNIRRAAEALGSVVIEPGGTWSFNEAVGPRTPERGYRRAPAFLERDLVTSVGGGICQVSSTLYNAAALSGLTIVERHPHFRRVASVPPGRDATVWYGMADLRLKNPFRHPVRLSLREVDEAMVASIRGHHGSRQEVRVTTLPTATSRSGAQAFRTVRKTIAPGKAPWLETLSVDTYPSFR